MRAWERPRLVLPASAAAASASSLLTFSPSNTIPSSNTWTVSRVTSPVKIFLIVEPVDYTCIKIKSLPGSPGAIARETKRRGTKHRLRRCLRASIVLEAVGQNECSWEYWVARVDAPLLLTSINKLSMIFSDIGWGRNGLPKHVARLSHSNSQAPTTVSWMLNSRSSIKERVRGLTSKTPFVSQRIPTKTIIPLSKLLYRMGLPEWLDLEILRTNHLYHAVPASNNFCFAALTRLDIAQKGPSKRPVKLRVRETM